MVGRHHPHWRTVISYNGGQKQGKVPKLEGTTTGFAHVPGHASYASISKPNSTFSAWWYYSYLTTFTSESAGETLLID